MVSTNSADFGRSSKPPVPGRCRRCRKVVSVAGGKPVLSRGSRPALPAFAAFVLTLGCAPGLGPVAVAAGSIYSQAYTIFIRGAQAGSEVVSEELDPSGNLVASTQSEILINDGFESKRMAFVTRLVLAKGTLAPISYSYRYTSGSSGDGYEVKIKDGAITRLLTREGRTSEATGTLAQNAVLIDFNVFHQYDYVVRRYDGKKGGRQTFPNYIPLIASDVQLALTRLDDSRLEYGRGQIPVRNFRVEFVGVRTASLATDKDGRLVRLVIREQDLEVVRTNLLPEQPPPTKP